VEDLFRKLLVTVEENVQKILWYICFVSSTRMQGKVKTQKQLINPWRMKQVSKYLGVAASNKNYNDEEV
jgi:hypothetical protein